VDTKTPFWKTMTREIIPGAGIFWEHENSFWMAAYDGRLDIVERMIQYGEPQNFGHALKGAVEGVEGLESSVRVQSDIIKRILLLMDKTDVVKPYPCGKTCLHLCVDRWHTDKIERLDEKSTLQLLEIFKMLMENFDDKNLLEDDNDGFIDGRTPLHMAARNGLKDFVKLIMDAVEEKCPTSTCSEFTPLHLAAMEGHFEVCQLINELIPENKNMRDSDGKTPADLARDRAIIDLFNN